MRSVGLITLLAFVHVKKLASAKDRKPKKPLSAWVTWLQYNHERIAANPENDGESNFFKKAVRMWKKLPDEEVKPYEAMASKALQKPVSAYGAFLNDHREGIAAFVEGAKGSFLKKAEEMWLTLADEERKSYEDLATKAKEGYEEGPSLFMSPDKLEDALSNLGHDVPIAWRITSPGTLCFRCKLGPLVYYNSTQCLLCQGVKDQVKAMLSYFVEYGARTRFRKRKIKIMSDEGLEETSSARGVIQFSPAKTPIPKRALFSPVKTPQAKTAGSAYAPPGRSVSRTSRALFLPKIPKAQEQDDLQNF